MECTYKDKQSQPGCFVQTYKGPMSSVLIGRLKQMFMQEAARIRLNMLLSGDLKRLSHNSWFEVARGLDGKSTSKKRYNSGRCNAKADLIKNKTHPDSRLINSNEIIDGKKK